MCVNRDMIPIDQFGRINEPELANMHWNPHTTWILYGYKKAGSMVKFFNPKTIGEVTGTVTSSGTIEEDAFKKSGEDGEDEGDEEYAAKKEGDGPDQLVDNMVKTRGIEDVDI